MKINKHIEKLDYPEHTNLHSKSRKIDLAHHKGRTRRLGYLFSQNKELLVKIARQENVRVGNILITAGGDAALHHIAETFLADKRKAIIPIPTFGRFEFHTKIAGAKVIFVEHKRFPYSFNLERITRKAKREKADVIFVANPNNPTGELVERSVLKRFVRKNENCLVVIDEALIEKNNDSCNGFVNTFNNLLVVKSLSKTLGIPGLRVGYILGKKELIRTISKTVSPYEISSLSILSARKFLGKRGYARNRHKETKTARDILTKQLNLPLSKTMASVVLISGKKKSPSLFNYTLNRGFLTVDGRNFRGLENTNTIRIVIPDTKTIKKFILEVNNYA